MRSLSLATPPAPGLELLNLHTRLHDVKAKQLRAAGEPSSASDQARQLVRGCIPSAAQQSLLQPEDQLTSTGPAQRRVLREALHNASDGHGLYKRRGAQQRTCAGEAGSSWRVCRHCHGTALTCNSCRPVLRRASGRQHSAPKLLRITERAAQHKFTGVMNGLQLTAGGSTHGCLGASMMAANGMFGDSGQRLIEGVVAALQQMANAACHDQQRRHEALHRDICADEAVRSACIGPRAGPCMDDTLACRLCLIPAIGQFGNMTVYNCPARNGACGTSSMML